MIEVVAFDADDTLWHNEIHYKQAEARFEALMRSTGYEGEPMEVLNATEGRNVPLYGYGFKSFTLSMIEAAVEIGGEACRAEWIQEILGFSREILQYDVELLPRVLDTLAELKKQYKLMLITKGELTEQERKIRDAGVSEYFSHIKILGDKSTEAYRDLLELCGIDPAGFVMVGNSLRSDILPVVAIGGRAVHIPYETTWVYEQVEIEEGMDTAYATIEHLGLLPDLIDSFGNN